MLEKFSKIKKNLYWIGWAVMFLILVGFTSKRQVNRTCQDIHIHIDNQLDNFFIEKADVIGLMTNGNRIGIQGLNKDAINLKDLEEKIRKNSFVMKTVVNQAHNGDLYVKVAENKPLARVFVGNKSFYLDDKGHRLPLSTNYTARVVVVNASKYQPFSNPDFCTTKEGKKYVELVEFIDAHPLWKKQISEIIIDKKGRVSMLTLIGKQEVRFGPPTDMPEKFEKLDIFFKKILPSVGWNKYKIVILEFNKQIVCE